MSARIVIQEKDKKRRIFELTEEITTIGRGIGNLVEIIDPIASRFHCHIRRVEGGYEVVDLGSKNGTFVNGRIVSRKFLSPGDKIGIGNTIISFETVEKRETGSETDEFDTQFVSDKAKTAKTEVIKQHEEEQLPSAETLLKVLELNKALNSELHLKRLLEKIMDTVLEVVKAERCFLIMFQDGEMEVQFSRNLDKESIPKPLVKFSSSIATLVRDTSMPIISFDAQSDERFKEQVSVHGLKLRSVMCVPLKVKRRILGVVYVDNRFEKGAFSETDLRLLEIISDQAAVAIENARLFEENVRRQRELQQSKQEVEKLNIKLQEQVRKQSEELQEAQSIIRQRKFPLKYDYEKIVTRSAKMQDIFSLMDKVTDSKVPVLIQGESGTGKELVARALHFNGPRKNFNFVTQNCGAVPSELLESEFFGYTKGAFTGAVSDKSGLFEMAHQGTLFLDEVAELSPAMQAKFLRVLEDGEIRRIGSNRTVKVDVRIISASNKDLFALVREGKFREDLYYRLNVVTIELPPLRERKEDIPLLVDHFLSQISSRTHTQKKKISADALRILERYAFPGNVRELENEIERAAMVSGDIITREHLSGTIRNYCTNLSASKNLPINRDKPTGLKKMAEEAQEAAERNALIEALKAHNWKKSAVAKALGISRPTLDAKIAKYRIEKSIFPTEE